MRNCLVNSFLLFLFPIFGVAQATFTVTVKKYTPDCELAAVAVDVNGGVPPYSIQWSNGALGDTLSSLPAGGYSIHITDSDNNDTTLGLDIEQRVCKVTFSRHFTPNGDGINDTWGIGGNIKDHPDFLLEVYDRWGQLVHKQSKQYIPWDGTHLGIKVPEATYYFIFFYKEGKTKEFEKGSITIVR